MKIETSLHQPVFYNHDPVIDLVQGDTRPTVLISLRDEFVQTANGIMTWYPVDVSTANTILKLKNPASVNAYAHVFCQPVPGLDDGFGNIDFAEPYYIPGKGGRILVQWNEDSLSEAGNIEGEIEVTFEDGRVQTVLNNIKMHVKAQFLE